MRSLPSSVNVRRVGQVGVDAALLALAYYLAYCLRFDDGIPHRYQDLLADTIWITVPMQVAIYAAFGLYSKLWRFVDQKDFETILKATVVSTGGPDRGAVPVLDRPPRPAAQRDRARLPAGAGVRLRRPLRGALGVRAPGARGDARARGPRGADRRAPATAASRSRPSCAATPACAARRSASWTTTRASRACAWPATRCSARPTSCRACSTPSSPTR